MRDAEVEKVLRNNLKFLSPELRKSSANIASIRMGTISYLVMVMLVVGMQASILTPAAFMTFVFSWTMLFAVIGFVAAVCILTLRAMALAPHFIEAYAILMKDDADVIRQLYGERGLADVIAPWIKGKPGIIMKMTKKLARRFYMHP